MEPQRKTVILPGIKSTLDQYSSNAINGSSRNRSWEISCRDDPESEATILMSLAVLGIVANSLLMILIIVRGRFSRFVIVNNCKWNPKPSVVTENLLPWLLFAILANLGLANVYKLPQLISKAKHPKRWKENIIDHYFILIWIFEAYSNMMEPKLDSGMKGAVHSDFSHLNFDANFRLCLDGAMPSCFTRAVSTSWGPWFWSPSQSPSSDVKLFTAATFSRPPSYF